MARIGVFHSEEVAFSPSNDMNTGEEVGAYRIRHPGGAEELQLFEVMAAGPGQRADVHAHLESEIIYIVAGEMHLGVHVLKPGDSVQIEGLSLYSFHAGPEGLRFLNFRARKDHTYFTPAELAAFKKLDPEARPAAISENQARVLKAMSWEDA